MWQSLEVCRVPESQIKSLATAQRSWNKALATQLVQKIEVVTIREPSYASFIQWVYIFT
jgi:hypothetical protein